MNTDDLMMLNIMMVRMIKDMQIEIEALKRTAEHTPSSKRYEECKREVLNDPKIQTSFQQYNSVLNKIAGDSDISDDAINWLKSMLEYEDISDKS